MSKHFWQKKPPVWIYLLLLVVCTSGLSVYLVSSSTEKPTTEEQKAPSYRADYHFTAPDKWKNDPQRPVYFNGKYHYYYLYNKDYPSGNGTEWRHATSEDLVHWHDEGIAIPKYTNKNGDPWSGSVVVDKNNTAGFGQNAFVAIVTQPSKNGGKQEQFLWYSTDHGKTFTSYSDKLIMSNPGTKDFRDPKIIWDDEHHKWMMVMAEGTKIGFYESADLKNWQYTSGFFTKDIGLIECPDLYMMRADDGTVKWVLGASANGKTAGKPNTYAYWIGTFDGKEFSPDHNEPQWLDYGFDWYGGVTFESGTESDKLTKRYALAWMNNWDYAHNTPTLQEGFNGMDSIVRDLTLKHAGDHQYYLASQPIEALNELTASTDYYEQIEVDGTKTLPVSGDVYQLETDISWSDLQNTGLRLRESADRTRHVDVGIFTAGGYSYVNRGFTGHPDKTNHSLESKAPFDTGKKQVHVKVLVDKTSIEVFIDDGKVAHSSLIFPPLTDKGITLFSEGGKAVFKHVKIQHLN
ncbi:glycoside hydrolase family 32 protein [Domibacillus indicus]|uniref:glycoside hydrolase family 32 protein n=1 Tax=Domibacillus indicus TaxID=1437523 RepID=UPI002041BB88|nr:glycoside hydrolase family 32 protein [Domibacillus indicus]MCM3790698.1 glycoside hydrolase family 32 protein [Domibacillus indicus]